MAKSKYQYACSYSLGRAVRKHVAVAEKALGKVLPLRTVVHHIDGNGLNNANTNLVLCPSESYHKLLHRRTEALAVTGNANAVKCQYCQTWDTPEKLRGVIKPERQYANYWHLECRNTYRRNKYKGIKNEPTHVSAYC